jgi:SNF2 family DNA or RNA helicase
MDVNEEQLPPSTRNYFLTKTETIPENLILFKDINMKISNQNPCNYDLVYFQITNKPSDHTFSNIDIMGENEFQEQITLATFYKQSNETFGITEILTNSTYLNKMKLKVILRDNPNVLYSYYSNAEESLQWILDISIYIDKDFLLHLYDTEKIPKFLFKIIKENTEKYPNTFNHTKITTNNSFYSNNQLNKTYKRNQYEYQKNNVDWMIQHEYNIANDKTYDTFKLPIDYYVYTIPDINIKLISDNEGKILNMDSHNTSIELKGGVLCDEVGLGKTFSMLSLVAEQLEPNNPPTLIICPPRLCAQWIEEMNNTFDFKCKLIRDIRQFRKCSVEEYNKFDIVILSYNFILGKSYKTLLEEEPDKNTFLHNFMWERVILDEGHEYINNNRKKTSQIMSDYLKTVDSKYKWICSGTPFHNSTSFENIISYVSNIEYNKELRHETENVINMFFRKNTKESVGEQVSIPKPIITTEFLNMTPLERMIYDSALGDKDKKIELCNHIMVSDEHITILGNKPMSLEEIHEKMTVDCKNKMEKYTKRQTNLENELNNLHTNPIENMNIIEEKTAKLEETKAKLKEATAKYNIFSDLENKIKEEECCPICMEELDGLTKTLTPCGHLFCSQCINEVHEHSHNSKIKCAMCRFKYDVTESVVIKNEVNEVNEVNEEEEKTGPKLGTKIDHLIKTVKGIIEEDNTKKIIVFSQWDNMLKLISKIFTEYDISHIFVNGSINTVSAKIRKFKIQNDINVVLMSSDKSPSGLNLTEATTIILLDTLNTSKEESQIIEEQAIGRAVRIGQTEKVNVKRFIMRNTVEHDYYVRNIET